ncbi:MAG TPA: hypothetical protein VF092_19815 [Longimicrobium sp.]
MRRIGGFLAVGAVMLATSACANGFAFAGFRPSESCSVTQARAYRVSSIMSTRSQVSAVQARYSYNARYVGPLRQQEGWKSLASGECRR